MLRRVALKDTNDAIKITEEDGGVILSNFSSTSDIQKLNDDAGPYINAVKQNRDSHGLSHGTIRCTRMFGRSSTAREILLQQPDFLKILRHFLATKSTIYNGGETKINTDPILSASSTLYVGPGEQKQEVHRDDFIWQQEHEGQATYKTGSDVGAGLLVAGTNTTYLNGATLVIPGSHLWSHESGRIQEDKQPVPAELKISEALFFLGSTVHGAGSNQTQEGRLVHGFFYCRSFIRPEENQHVWWTKQEIQKWSPAAQKQAGYILDSSFIGHCGETDPIEKLGDEERIGSVTG